MRIAAIIFIFLMLSCSATVPVYTTKITGNALQVPVGGFENSSLNIVNDPGVKYSILLIKRSQLAYDAVYMKCSHDDAALDVGTNNLVCNVCGSTYNFDGTNISGPSPKALTKFPTELNPDATLVRIDIEALGL